MESILPASTVENKIEETEKAPVDHQLKELSNKCLHSGKLIKLKVRRNFVWEDILLKLKRLQKKTLATGAVNVQFIGEPAVDEGGPRKELFYLIHRHMQTSGLVKVTEMYSTCS